MGRINQLKPEVFNMIAAGEVVERPASVVKELVENSIDAGASSIEISIVDGGIKKIIVSDDGAGILPEDMRLAFLPHATSKIKDFNDIDVLSTLGFRGEALASIASVSEVKLTTTPKGGECATISLKGGEIVSEGFASRSQGTTIEVENLFFNTPARLKFLKKSSSEANLVVDTVRKLMLANPEIAIKLNVDGKMIFEQQSGTLEDSIYSVYDSKTMQGLLPVAEEFNGIRIDGFISKIEFTKSNRTYQTIIINGRCVESQVVQTAVEQGYSGFLMKRCYPVYVLNIIMPFDQLDVNVHPRKAEVRFSNQQAVFSAVYHTINSNISKYAHDIVVNFANSRQGILEQEEYRKKIEGPKPEQTKFDTSNLYKAPIRQKPDYLPNLAKLQNPENDLNSLDSTLEKSDYNFSQNPTQIGTPEYSKSEYSISNDSLESTPIFDGEIIGQLFDTYILVEQGEMAYLIDQHAAHERILYEKIKKNLDNMESQPLLVPYTLYLSGTESDYFIQIIPKLNSMGFDVIKEGETKFTFYAVPEILVGIDIKKFMGNLFEDMISDEDLNMEVLVKDKISQQACKAAIKGGNEFSGAQLKQVVQALLDEQGNLPSKCPHGRPTVVAISKKDIEKLFKRIV